MNGRPTIPRTAPFTAEQIALLNDVVGKSTTEQRTWLAGYLAGIEAAQGSPAKPAAPPRAKTPLTILYGTESGNSENLAMKARKLALTRGFDARILDMADAEPGMLGKMKNVLVIAATWGEGEPPQRAQDFYAALMADNAPRIEGVRFGVLALGDTAYVNFCSIGKNIDARLEALGGIREVARADLDLDFAKAAAAWTETALTTLAPKHAEVAAGVAHEASSGAHPGLFEEQEFTEENPLSAEITQLINLNGAGSTRETWHVELATGDSGLAYEPGDSIGIIPQNDPEMVAAVLKAAGLAGDTALGEELQTKYEITTLTRPVVDKYAKLTGRKEVAALLEGDALVKYTADRQIVDFLEAHPHKLSPSELKELLRPLPARLYSLASSQKTHAGEAHILVGAVRWEAHGHARRGVASTYLGDRRRTGDQVKIYVKPNRHFRLPTDGNRPIVMIGAGTGVAPYRAFIEERIEAGAKGKSWLVFGERNYTNDFLYQLEWQEQLAAGALSRIDVAFSRDQPEKIYVQHRLWQQREQLTGWVADGAYIYVCGDEKGMAKDVDAMLVQILAGGQDSTKGQEKLTELRKAGRYLRDVY